MQSVRRMSDSGDETGKSIALVFAIIAIVGAIALFALAAHTWPTDPHHGEAVDGLDGLGTFFALVEGAGGVVLLLIGAVLVRVARSNR